MPVAVTSLAQLAWPPLRLLTSRSVRVLGGGEPVMCDVLLSVMHTRLFYSVSDEHCGHF